MAIATFSRKRFEKEIGKLTPEIEEKISMFGTPFENANSQDVNIEVFPNRPDLFSFDGFKRSFLSYLGKAWVKKYTVKKSNFVVEIDKSVEDIRPYTVCAVIKNLKFDDEKIKEVIDVQEKLHTTIARNRKRAAIGIYPLEKIKFPIKYQAKHPNEIQFVPLESSSMMYGDEILEQLFTGRTYAHLLRGKKLFPIFTDADNNILSMPPIINSNETGKVTEKTKEIFIECSGYNIQILNKILNILVCMFADIGGEIYEVKLKYPENQVFSGSFKIKNFKDKKEIITPNLQPEKLKLNLDNVNKILGIKLNEGEIKKLLEKMGHEYKNKTAFIPAYRVDILHEVDLIEDIAIAYGYENFFPEIPSISTIGSEDNKEIIKRKISDLLIGLDISEVSSYHLANKEFLKKIEQKDLIEVENSKTDYSILRPNLISSALKILSENTDAEYPQRIFEIGRAFELDKDKIDETERAIVALSSIDSNFTKIKQILDYTERMLGIKLEIEESEEPYFISGRVGKILLNGKRIGVIGEINPSILKSLRIKMPTSVFELKLEEIFKNF
jgi:phenylalanyl-tRNA synthetase beta chain